MLSFGTAKLGLGVIECIGRKHWFTSLRSSTNLKVLSVAVFTGRIAVLQSERGHGTNTPLSSNALNFSCIPCSASLDKGC